MAMSEGQARVRGEPEDSASVVVGHLRRLIDPRRRDGQRVAAVLRRSLAHPPAQDPACWEIVEPLIALSTIGWPREVVYLVAALYASHPVDQARGQSGRSLGAALRRLDGGPAIDRRVARLVLCDQATLPAQLRSITQLLARCGIGVDWAQLLRDLLAWDKLGRPVQSAWARAYWGPPATPPSSPQTGRPGGGEPSIEAATAPQQSAVAGPPPPDGSRSPGGRPHRSAVSGPDDGGTPGERTRRLREGEVAAGEDQVEAAHRVAHLFREALRTQAAALRRAMQHGDVDSATEDLGDLSVSFSTPEHAAPEIASEHAAPEITAPTDEIGEH